MLLSDSFSKDTFTETESIVLGDFVVGTPVQKAWDFSGDRTYQAVVDANCIVQVEDSYGTWAPASGFVVRPICQTKDGDINDSGHRCFEVENQSAAAGTYRLLYSVDGVF